MTRVTASTTSEQAMASDVAAIPRCLGHAQVVAQSRPQVYQGNQKEQHHERQPDVSFRGAPGGWLHPPFRVILPIHGHARKPSYHRAGNKCRRQQYRQEKTQRTGTASYHAEQLDPANSVPSQPPGYPDQRNHRQGRHQDPAHQQQGGSVNRAQDVSRIGPQVIRRVAGGAHDARPSAVPGGGIHERRDPRRRTKHDVERQEEDQRTGQQ